MDKYLRELRRKWKATTTTEDGVIFLLALLRAQSVDLTDFPLDILKRANLRLTSTDRSSVAFRNQNLLYGVPINELLGQLQEQMQSYWEVHQPEPGPDGAIPAFDRIAYWFAANNLPPEQALASQNVVGAPINDYDDYYEPGVEYDIEDIFYNLIVWYPDISEIRVFTASQYADTYGDILADFSQGYAQAPQNIPDPMGVLREFTFKLSYDSTIPEGWQPEEAQRVWQLVSINVIAHQQGLWSHDYNNEYFENLISLNRRNYFILIDEIRPALPLNQTPFIVRGSCEDWPACGHDRCPPRWSHTGGSAGMICAICGGEMPPGPSSIHSACYRQASAYDDPNEYPDEDEETEEFDNDRMWYEESDDYDY